MIDKILRDGLEMLLLHASPVEVMQIWINPKNGLNAYIEVPNIIKNQMAKRYPERYSLDDANKVHSALSNQYEEHYKPNLGVFSLIFDFADQVLIQKEHRAFIKYEEVLRWRHTIHPFGTAPFICSFLAQEDIHEFSERRMFSFNPVISTDNRRLKIMLKLGMAENHFHLKGSAPSFLMSWICLMNDITNRRAEFNDMDKNSLTESLDCNNRKMYVLVWQAAAIRAFLFTKLLGLNLFETNNSENKSIKKLKEYLNFQETEECEFNTFDLQNAISSLKELYHLEVEEGFTPDYAIKYLATKDIDKTFDIFSGECWFLYSMFKAMLENDKNIMPYLDLFYAYILIGIRFRSELVQTNKQFGFQNFSEYESRKSKFLRGDNFEKAQLRIASMTNLADKRILSLEVRIVPKFDSRNLGIQIEEINRIIKKATDKTYRHHSNDELITDDNDNNIINYVLHIPKRRDKTNNKNPSSYINSRDNVLRKHTEKVANSIIELREGCNPQAERIVGIDACANEIECRPEVFACAYRLLKKHQPPYLVGNKKAFPMLNITYHVGEDFLDITDGLRAIWEAIEFFELSRSDRLGHALALGINPLKWYKAKQNRIFLSRQDLLDNCAWMLHMLSYFGEMPAQLSYELNQVCTTQYAAIYQKNMPINERNRGFDLTGYINSMKLRGDEPSCYKFLRNDDDIEFDKIFKERKVLYPYDLRQDDVNSDLYEVRRHNKHAIRLYHHYHYTPKVKLAGTEVVEYKVSDLYIKGVVSLQKIMQKQISKKGIAIETNPSSNVLIGNFNRYDCHPLVVFNDLNLFDKEDNPLLFVSINTDDQGVFDTCLENEYALMARGLEQMTDGNGEPLVSPTKIYTWLDNIRKMGLEQSFNRSKFD